MEIAMLLSMLLFTSFCAGILVWGIFSAFGKHGDEKTTNAQTQHND